MNEAGPASAMVATDARVTVVAIIGAGQAGRRFALRCAAAGYHVMLEDVMPERLRRAQDEFSELNLDPGGIGRLEVVGTVEDAVRGADLAIDFVPDELESKLEIWSMIDRMAPPKTVMCTPSEALSITDLASCTYRADRCVMMRGALSGTARLLSAAGTSEVTRKIAATMLRGIGCGVEFEADPDLPMLLKNMRAVDLK
jgi:3-hydroxybutyryl-CoA dehydrogenase